MILVAKVKLKPSAEQAKILRLTLERVNAACDWVAAQAFEHRVFGQFKLHHLCYYPLREKFAMPSKLAVRLIAKVANAYKLDRKRQRRFRKHGAIDYDDGCLRWQIEKGQVSILTVTEGRQRIPFVCGDKQRQLLQARQGQSSLALVDGKFYLIACCNVEQPEAADVEDYLGVDMGIVNIATDSDGQAYSGGQVNGLRHRHRRLRQKLQAKGTKSAKRLLKKRSLKEARFARDVNHRISKEIVARAERTARGLAIEDIKGIRERIRVSRSQRATFSSWSFGQLGSFLSYKAALAGVPLVTVDPRNTSRTCPSCGHIAKANRPSQSLFTCQSCGFSGPADYIAALNIRGRAARIQPHAAGAWPLAAIPT